MGLLNKLLAWMTAKYDRIIAFVVFVLLAASLAYLAVRIGMITKLDRDFEQRVTALTAAHPEAEAVSESGYRLALSQVRNPTRLSDWTNDISVPQMRVWCIDCRRPVEFNARVCPFCGAEQPEQGGPVGLDSDGDDISDENEEALRLDPRNPDDAGLDLDGDLFSNLEEFLFGSDIRDATSHPPIEPYLRIERVEAIPFDFLFKSYMRWRGEDKIYAVNTRADDQTYMRKLGEKVEGFTLHSFEQNVIKNRTGPDEDKSVLTLKKGDRLIPLVKGDDVKYDEYTVHLVFDLDESTYTCKLGGTFELRPNRSYELIKIDSEKRSVVIQRLIDAEKFTVTTGSAARSGE